MRKWNKLLAMLLAMVMVLGLAATAFAAEGDAKPEDEKTEDTTPAEGEEKKDEAAPAEGEEDKKDETTPAEGEEDKKDEATPAEGEEDKKNEATPAEGEDDKKDEPAAAVTFSDVKEGRWYYEFVQKMVAAGIVEGYADGTFKPNDTLTWGAALKMTVVFATGEEKAPVEGGNWASGYAAYVKEQGIWTEEIDHNAKITRLEMCQLLAKTLKLEESKAESKFSDTKDGYVAALVELGVIDGNPDGTFAPGGELTRAALCKILASVPDAGDANTPAEGEDGKEGGAAPAEGEEDKKDETAPAEGEDGQKDETTPAEGEDGQKDETTPAGGEDGKGDDAAPDAGKGE